MKTAQDFINTYQGEPMDQILSRPDLDQDLKSVQAELDSLDPETQRIVRDLLSKILQAVDVRMTALSSEMADIKDTMKRVEENSKACLAYLNSAGAHNKK